MMIRLPVPDLDDLRWQTLVDEGRALIPAYAPEWTDHNAGDPGVTLMELFAYLAELDLFTLSQINPAQLRKLLALAGVAAAPPRASRAMVEPALRPGAAPRELPSGTRLEGRDPFGRTVPFRTLQPVAVQPGRLAVVATGDFVDVTARRPIVVFGDDPGVGSVAYFGLELPGPLAAGTELSLGAVPAEPATPAPDGAEHHSVRLVWEQLTAGGVWAAAPAEDTTRALTAEGRITVRTAWTLVPRALPGRPGPALGWLRARIVRGRHDAAPRLLGLAYNGVPAVQSEPLESTITVARDAVVTGTPPAPGRPAGLQLRLDEQDRIDRLAFGSAGDAAVPVLDYRPGTSLRIAAIAYRGTGGPTQRLEIPGAPLVAGSLRITGGGTGWRIVPDFVGSGRAAADATVDPGNGTVTFGDGEHGRVPAEGTTLLVTGDRTAAERGNLGAGAVYRVPDDDDVTARNVVPAAGGRAAETIAEAAARARAAREAPGRAVTPADHEALALTTPGTRIARAQALANRHPGFGCLTAPGVVTVVVLPSLPLGRPAPDAGLRRAVRAHLAGRRIIGRRIEVAAPEYVPVTVRAVVAANSTTDSAGLPAAVAGALDAFFHPLTGGPAGTGWPLGRDVYRAEVLAVIDRVPGVAHVRALELASAGETCGDLCVGPLGLVASGPHEIAVR